MAVDQSVNLWPSGKGYKCVTQEYKDCKWDLGIDEVTHIMFIEWEKKVSVHRKACMAHSKPENGWQKLIGYLLRKCSDF